MNTETAASIAVREQYAAQLKRHEEVFAQRARSGVIDVWLADVISRLAIAIKGEAAPWVPR